MKKEVSQAMDKLVCGGDHTFRTSFNVKTGSQTHSECMVCGKTYEELSAEYYGQFSYENVSISSTAYSISTQVPYTRQANSNKYVRIKNYFLDNSTK